MKIRNLALIVPAALAAGALAAAAATETNTALITNTTDAPANTVLATNIAVAPQTNAPATNAPPVTNIQAIAEANDAAEITPTNAVRMNFVDAPLNTIVTYLSAKMGLSVISDGPLRGTATIVSEQPVGTNDVITLLSAALAKNNYAVTTNGKVLTIMSVENAMTGPTTPVNHPESPKDIPMNDEIATDVLAVHTLDPAQLAKDLAELVPPGAKLSANQAGNALIMTGRQKDIHRFAEIIAALDSSSVAEVEVFVLKYADAKSVAAELKEVFQSPDSSVARSDARMQFRRGGGFGSFFGGGAPDNGNSSSTDTKNASNKAVFVSDDQMNAVVASAPPDYFPMITNVIAELDQPSDDITVIKVFHLTNSDPSELADQLSNLYPDPTKTADQSTRTMGMRFLPPWMQQQQNSGNNKSDRMTRQTLVRAVPDPRTARLTVTASRDQMKDITAWIQELDSDPSQVQKVWMVDSGDADTATVQAAMTAMFAGQNTKAPTSTQNASSLASRAQAGAQQQSSTSSTTSGLGSTGTGTPGLH